MITRKVGRPKKSFSVEMPLSDAVLSGMRASESNPNGYSLNALMDYLHSTYNFKISRSGLDYRIKQYRLQEKKPCD